MEDSCVSDKQAGLFISLVSYTGKSEICFKAVLDHHKNDRELVFDFNLPEEWEVIFLTLV